MSYLAALQQKIKTFEDNQRDKDDARFELILTLGIPLEPAFKADNRFMLDFNTWCGEIEDVMARVTPAMYSRTLYAINYGSLRDSRFFSPGGIPRESRFLLRKKQNVYENLTQEEQELAAFILCNLKEFVQFVRIRRSISPNYFSTDPFLGKHGQTFTSWS